MTSPNTPPSGQPDPAALLALGLATQAADAGASSTPQLSPGELAAEFPQLEILELLGRGGMGAVYKARQRDLDRLVALKILRPGLDADPGFAERFTREARALAQLNHPGIVTLYEFGKTSAGRYFILMEFVDGVNLRQLLAAGRLSPREALAIVPPLCDALQYAHDRRLIHRDIKPENLLIDRLGRVKIADFGIAKIATGKPEASLSVEIAGTPAYMAPEQRDRPGAVDHRADLYALGVVFYQMLTGELPAADQLRPPSTRVQLDVRLDEIVLRALQKDPARRYAAASDFKTQIETVSQAAPIISPRRVCINRLVLRRIAAVALVCLVFTLLFFRLGRADAAKPAIHAHSPSSAAALQPSPSLTERIAKAEAWLLAMDEARYTQGWHQASASLRAAVSENDWQAMLQKARGSFGASVNRQLDSSYETWALPDAPFGHYSVLQFWTVFADGRTAIEILTTREEAAGDWEVAGYIIRPRTAEEKNAIYAANVWLTDIDAGRFELSWDRASKTFREAISRRQWKTNLDTVRQSLGKIVFRMPETTQTIMRLPGAPDGRYVIITFKTSFSKKAAAVETLTFIQESDTEWRLMGYFIQ